MGNVYLTAVAMLKVLEDGEIHIAGDFRDEVADEGGSIYSIQAASKWLKDRGIPVHCHKKGWRSEWSLAADAMQMHEYWLRITREHYSQMVSHARASSLITGTGSRKSYREIVAACVTIGASLGFDADRVLADCKPRPSGLSERYHATAV